MSEIERVAQLADFIVNGYSFICENGKVRVLNLNDTSRAAVLDENGEVRKRKYIDFTAAVDERIADGFNIASGVKMLQSLLKHPHRLDQPPESVVEDCPSFM